MYPVVFPGLLKTSQMGELYSNSGFEPLDIVAKRPILDVSGCPK